MSKRKYLCKNCKRFFNDAIFYEEGHGFASPPYEMVAVCPRCKSDDFIAFISTIEKIEVAEKTLPVIKNLNNFIFLLSEIFGSKIRCSNLSDSVEELTEFICEMFDFINVDTQRNIFEIKNENDVNKILLILKGEL